MTFSLNEIPPSPFDGQQTTCYLSQFFNAIYVLDGDASDPTSIHIFDAKSASWSTQKVQPGGPDPNTLTAILDHDSNDFCSWPDSLSFPSTYLTINLDAVDNGTISFLSLGQETVANSTAISWVLAENTPYGQDYKPTMALAQNHIHFIGVSGAQPGSAEIYVIHCAIFILLL